MNIPFLLIPSFSRFPQFSLSSPSSLPDQFPLIRPPLFLLYSHPGLYVSSSPHYSSFLYILAIILVSIILYFLLTDIIYHALYIGSPIISGRSTHISPHSLPLTPILSYSIPFSRLSPYLSHRLTLIDIHVHISKHRIYNESNTKFLKGNMTSY